MSIVLVTGGAGGIGSAICKAFAAKGNNVIVHYKSKKKAAEELAESLAAEFDIYAYSVYADVSDSTSVAEMFDLIESEVGEVDIMINNAGIAEQKLFTDITDEDWKQMTGVNLDGVFYCCREVLRRYMIRNHSGVILNISSMWGQAGASCEVHYSAAKAGVIGLTKALAKEVGLSGVRVNCIAPGVVLTNMMKSFDGQTLAELRDETPLNRLGTPDDIAKAAVFLCSEKADFITGQILGVNGGMII